MTQTKARKRRTKPRPMTSAQVRAANARVPEVWAAGEVAAELGIDRRNLNKVGDLPEPFGRVSTGLLWRADVIRAFAANRPNRQQKKGGV